MSGARADRGRRWLRISALGLALVCITGGFWHFCDAMRAGAITNDWPWLYRTGRSIWQHGLPTHDTLSWTFPERGWVLYQWLFEAIAAPLYGAAGATVSVILLCLFGFALYAAAPAWYLARRGVHPLITLSIGSLVLVPVGVNFALRPMLATLALMAVQWVWLSRWRVRARQGWRCPAAIFCLYALWANLHLGFTLGLASLCLFAVTDLCGVRGPGLIAKLGRRFTRWAWLVVAAVLGTGANPYGWTLYGYIWTLSHKSTMNAHIHELMPPDPTRPVIQLAIGLGVGLVLLCLLAVRRRAALPWGALWHVALFAAMTSQAIRIVVWAGLASVVAAAPLVQAIADTYRRAPSPVSAQRLPGTHSALIALIVVMVALVFSAISYGPVRVADCKTSAHAIRVLDARLPADTHWFASERVGSCTALVAPARRVFIDTRFDFYPEAFVLDWFEAYQHRRHWRSLFERWAIDTVLLADTAPLVPALENDPRFKRERIDAHMLLFSRR